MTKNTSIYIILNFLLLILFIDIYVSFNVKNNEQFTVNEINDENIVIIIDLICNLSTNDENNSIPDEIDFLKHRLNLVNFLMKEHEDNIQNYFRKVHKSVETNELLDLYEEKSGKLGELRENIKKIQINYSKNDMTSTDLTDEQIISNAENKIFFENINIKNIVRKYLNETDITESCKDVLKFLIIYYMKNLHSINTPNKNKYKISFLFVLQNLIDNKVNCQN